MQVLILLIQSNYEDKLLLPVIVLFSQPTCFLLSSASGSVTRRFFQYSGNLCIILSCYGSCAYVSFFSGYFLDSFARKPLYLFAYFIFMMMFAGYMIAGSLTLIYYVLYTGSFGMVTVGGNTVVIDIMPSSRRGEGLGYYGNNIAMAVGPMSVLFLHDAE